MNPIMKQLGDDAAAIFGSPALFRDIARPVSPHPLFPVVEVPEDRSDFTRDDESTGV
ncbi:hypothetical protein [Lysobacter enzymogenes]|uniref:hypothetical protein n=1 Tax=Lysobacter enzymogenes TaxID=69 RepID=UPI001A9612F6|nr:hypothetical protein [Lysobacter enzymogenes]QQP96477.1 hypothetical protein JHW38_25325 [Lysobacter enzymogenes]QQP96511.1 hypothetical protein JHW38_00175 [Lysobacter enzymogenes]